MILLYHGKSLTSILIRFVNWRDVSHASYSFATVQGNRIVGDMTEYEAWITNIFKLEGCVHSSITIGDAHTKGTIVDVYEPKQPLTNEESARMREFLIQQLGKKYDFRGVLNFLMRGKGDNPDKWFCSELVFAAFLHVQRVLLANIPAYKVFPGLLAQSTELNYRGYIVIGDDTFTLHPVTPRFTKLYVPLLRYC